MLEPIRSSATQIFEPSAAYTRNTELPTLFGDALFTGSYLELDENLLAAEKPCPFY